MSYQMQLDNAILAAKRAGELLRSEFHRPTGPRGTQHHADVDMEAEIAIRDQLLSATPTYGFLGEETEKTGPIASQDDPQRHAWIVDPNDGTLHFMLGRRGSAVSIALICDSRLVLGVVFAFNYPTDAGDLIAWAEGCNGIQRNGITLPKRRWARELSSETSVLLSPGADNVPEANAKIIAPARFRTMPSIAYRLALVAAGEAEATVSLNGPCSWDFAAGHALIQAAGGMLGNENGNAIVYSASGNASAAHCYAGHADVVWKLAHRKWTLPRTNSKVETTILLEPGKRIADANVLDHGQGCLMGQLAGDALGQLVEFQAAATIQSNYPNGVRILKDGGTWNTLAGQPTDDSEMALSLARSLLNGGYDQESAAKAYAHWLNSGPYDIGATTRQALSRPASALRNGTTSGLAEMMCRAANLESQANGSLMRISPLGIAGWNIPPERLADQARQDAQLTHPHSVCQDAGVAFTWAIAFAIRTGCSAVDVFEATCEYASQQKLHEDIIQVLRSARSKLPEFQQKMGWVRIALQNAFYQLIHANNFEAGVVETVMQGGDTDTNGAIAGALLGAVHGLNAVPGQWKERILACRPIKESSDVHQPRPQLFWPVDALTLAEALLVVGQ